MMCLYFLLVLTLMYMMLVVGQLPLQINLVTQAFPFLCLGAARNKTFFSLATQLFTLQLFNFTQILHAYSLLRERFHAIKME